MYVQPWVEVVDILASFISILKIENNVVDTQTSLVTTILQVNKKVRQMSEWRIVTFTKLQSIFGNEQAQDIWGVYMEKRAKLCAFSERFYQTTGSFFKVFMERLMCDEPPNACVDVLAVMSMEKRQEAVKQSKEKEKLTLEWKLKIDELTAEWDTIKEEVVKDLEDCLMQTKVRLLDGFFKKVKKP